MDEYPYPLLVEGDWSSVSSKTLRSKVHIYFQSRRKSQGGDCVISWSEKSCSVRFKSEQTRNQVLGKAEHVVQIEQLALKLTVSIPPVDSGSRLEDTSQTSAKTGRGISAETLQAVDARRTEAAEGSADAARSNSVVLENVPEAFRRDFLILLVEAISGNTEEELSLELVPESSVAVVTFNDPDAAGRFLTECGTNRRFQENRLRARRLEESRSVKVESFPAEWRKDYLELYFEKFAEVVEDIQLIEDEQVAIITFQDQQAVQKVLGKKHVIGNTPVNIYPFYPSLGSALYGKDRPTWSLPKPFTYKIHPAIREFLQKQAKIPNICKQMSSHFCQVNMDNDEVLISPLPGLLRQKGLNEKKIAGWKQDTMDAFRNILSSFDSFEHAVSLPVWTSVEKDVRSVVKDKAILKVDASAGCLTLAAMAKDIQVLKPILEKTLQDASSQMEREKMKISQSLTLPPAVFLLLQHGGLIQSANAKYPHLELTYRKDRSELTLTGLQLEVVDIKSVVLARQISLNQKNLQMDPLLLEFLGAADSEKMSSYLFISNKIGAAYRVENGAVVLSANSDQDLTEAEKKLETMLTIQRLPVEDLAVLKKTEWRNLTAQLQEAYSIAQKTSVLIKPLGDAAVVCGFQEPVREISENLEEFIKSRSRTEETVHVKSYATAKFIKEKKAQVWQSDTLDIDFDSKRPLIRVSGERYHVQSALVTFRNIEKSLHTDRFTIRKAGAKKFFQEQSMMVWLMIKEQRFVVVLEDASMVEEARMSSNKGAGKGGELLSCEVLTPGGIAIKVLQADMCSMKVDAVVNAANEDLKHIGGLALALLNAAGPSLQQSSDQYIAKHGKLQTGKAVTTEAGRLPCKYVVHAVGPRFNRTDSVTAVKQLRQAVRESLEQATVHRCSSVALPAISSGVFGFPIDLCTESIAQELHAYLDVQKRQGGTSPLKEIHLVANDPTSVNAMSQAVKEVFKEFNPTIPQQVGSGQSLQGKKNEAYQEQGAGKDGDTEYKTFRRESGYLELEVLPDVKLQLKPQYTDMDWSGSGVLEAKSTNEGLEIILRKGDIQDAHSDVIVNTASNDLDLSKGAISNAILNAAGPQLQHEADRHLQSHKTSRLKYGEIVITKGYNLNCQGVFHATCPLWSDKGSEKILRQIIEDCLNEAEKLKMTSISFPAIGTGNLKFPSDVVSKILLGEICTFSANVSRTYLKKVTVIVHPSASKTVESFVKSFKGDWQGTAVKEAHAVQQSPSKKHQPAGFIGALSTPSLGVHRMQIKHLTLEVSSGDITKERCDAIVNSSNSAFSLKSGVSKAILDAAGPVVLDECSRIVESQKDPGEMIMTSGGQLPCKHIIHIVGRNNPADIKGVVYSVLKLCEEQQFSSVAFPALGTGQGRAQPSEVAGAMIDALVEFVKKKKGTHLHSVKFLVFQVAMMNDFFQTMQKKQQESMEDEEGGFIGWVKETIASVTSFFGGAKAEDYTNKEFVLVGEEIEPAVFQLCGESEEDLHKARELIDSIIVKEHLSTKIEDSAISYFGQDEANILRILQRELQVSISLTKRGPEPTLAITGLTRDVIQVQSRIREMICKVEKKIARERDALKVAKQVLWHYQDSGNFVPFDIPTNYDLEDAFSFMKPCITISINKEPYKTNLAQMIATGQHGTIQLKRTELNEDVSLPSHWEDKKTKVELQHGSVEYSDVETEFRRSGLTSNILKIERIQNETLWKNYMNQKAYLEKKNKHTSNEKRLFHGTGSENIDKINERGFNRSFSGTHGAMIGNGSYFAVDSSYSAKGYSKPDQHGHKRMYLARVLVGDFTTGKQGLLTPPSKNSTGIDQYDSVTDSSQKMFVIFHDDYAYPEYLITFS